MGTGKEKVLYKHINKWILRILFSALGIVCIIALIQLWIEV
jgi:hypothetical protein